MTSFGYRLNPRYAIKECSSCGTLYTRNCSCSKGNVEDNILVPKPPKNCARYAKCGHPVNGSYCQGCALLREKLEEDLVTYFQNFQNTFESSDDSTNVVNAPREPFCQPMNQNFYNSNSSGFDQSQTPHFPVIHPPPQETSIGSLHDQENVINSVQTFLRKFNRYSFFETLKVLLLTWDRVFEIKDALGTKQYKPKDIQELFRQLLNDVQNIYEELAEYINTLGWNRIPDTICDVHLVNNPTPLEAKDHFEIVINSKYDISSSDDDSLYNENIEFVEASPHDSEVVSLEVAEIVIPEVKDRQEKNKIGSKPDKNEKRSEAGRSQK
nr:hypothetical protein [Tanacetum cinerariifolium]